jgi:hypothetical protein
MGRPPPQLEGNVIAFFYLASLSIRNTDEDLDKPESEDGDDDEEASNEVVIENIYNRNYSSVSDRFFVQSFLGYRTTKRLDLKLLNDCTSEVITVPLTRRTCTLVRRYVSPLDFPIFLLF